MKFRPLALTAALAVLPLAALAPVAAQAQNAPMTTNAQTPLLAFSLTEEVRAKPDRATIGAGVTTSAPTATEALRQNNVAMERLVAAVKKGGVKDGDVQTSGFSLSPQYDYTPTQNGGQPRLTGYQVSNQLRVTTKQVAKLGDLLDALIAAGGTNIDGPSFSVDDPDAMLDAARDRAVAKAMARANRYARLAGYKSARLVMISEGGGFVQPMPMPQMTMDAAAGAMVKSAPIEPGQVGNSLVVQFQFALEK
jgi:uncharacterized protein YggE